MRPVKRNLTILGDIIKQVGNTRFKVSDLSFFVHGQTMKWLEQAGYLKKTGKEYVKTPKGASKRTVWSVTSKGMEAI